MIQTVFSLVVEPNQAFETLIHHCQAFLSIQRGEEDGVYEWNDESPAKLDNLSHACNACLQHNKSELKSTQQFVINSLSTALDLLNVTDELPEAEEFDRDAVHARRLNFNDAIENVQNWCCVLLGLVDRSATVKVLPCPDSGQQLLAFDFRALRA